MPIKSNDFLVSADECKKCGNEAGYRNAISRAYYAMYHETLHTLQSVPRYSSNHHSNLIGYLKTKAENKLEPYDPNKMKVLGYNLDQQRKARHEADYEVSHVTVSEDMASAAIESANLYFQEWSNLKAAKAS
ncbi:hypothetical protein [Serratia marcescens]|uniref:hypothetical protein n=1 Tax=Serratia marcescens TaxID=615 RepID=UPI0011AEE1B5|nr:hypothetical protein [Serratia marcescens]